MTDEKKEIEQAFEAAVAELKARGQADAPAPEKPAEEPAPAPEPEKKPEPEKEPEKKSGKKPADKKARASGGKRMDAKKGRDKSGAAALKELAKVRRNKIIGITAAVVAIMVGIFLIAHNRPTDPAADLAKEHGGEPTVAEDGTMQYPDGTVVDTDGTIYETDGTVTMPDGTVVPPQQYAQPGDSNVNNVQADNGGLGGAAETPWKTMADGDYGISIRRLNPYTGKFLEDGSDDDVTNVLALQFRNDSAQAVQYAEYVFDVNGKDVIFRLSDLPVGSSCVVFALDRHPYNADEVLKLKSRLVAAVDALHPNDDSIMYVVSDEMIDGELTPTVTIQNLTDQPIPVARIFYKTYYAEQDTLVGGITYTFEVRNIPANGSSGPLSSEHFSSQMSYITGYGVYDS